MFKWLSKKLTKNYNEVPLLIVSFNLNKYKKDGATNSCEIKLHPELNDPYIKDSINILINHIRNNYDMEKMSK